MKTQVIPVDMHSCAKSILLKLILLMLTIITYPAVSAQKFVDDFESGSIQSDWKYNDSGVTPNIYSKITTSPVCNGSYALKSEAHYPPDYRTELKLVKNYFGELQFNKEYWIGVAIYLPSDYEQDGKLAEILFQTHHRPDVDLGEPKGGNPPFTLKTREGQWVITGKTKSEKLCGRECNKTVIRESVSPYKTNTWTEFVFNVKFTHTNSGFLKAWKDNELVLNYNGPIGYNDERGPWIIMGVYKSSWKYGKSIINKRIVYHDDFRIMEGSGSPSDVAPKCGKGNATTLTPPSNLKIISN